MTATEESDRVKFTLRIRNNPVWFIERILGGMGWAGQYEIIEAVRDNRHVVVKSCHSMGKDWISGRLVPWFLMSYYPSLVITTGPTDRQVRKILWKEIAKAYAAGQWALGGKLNSQELILDEHRMAIGFTTRDDPEKFAGFHSLNTLLIVDESSGISKTVHDAAQGILSGASARKLDIGNPTDPTSEFAEFFKKGGAKKLSYTAFDTPNFTKFGITQEDIERDTWREKITGPLPTPYLISPEWVADRHKKWGKNSPWYISRVEAKFPDAGEKTLISLALIEDAQERTLEPSEPNVLGIDVAREGNDKTVFAHRRGGVLRIHQRFSKIKTMETTGLAQIAKRVTGADILSVDVIGVGGGVVDRLVELKVPVIEANAAESPVDTIRFLNARAEWYWTLRELFETGEVDLDPADEDLAEQLTDIKWKVTSAGKIQIESKDEMRARGRPSPDDADAVAQTFANSGGYIALLQKAVKSM